MVLVNEDVPGPKVTDEEKYEEILAQRKQRKAVSKFKFIISFIKIDV